jgi:hypothetical protein
MLTKYYSLLFKQECLLGFGSGNFEQYRGRCEQFQNTNFNVIIITQVVGFVG